MAYIKSIHTLVRWLGISDGNMAEGSFRADCNVSLRRPGQPFGTRCELKNLNSSRFIEQAINVEIERQMEILEWDGTIDQETRLFDSSTGETRTMRSKENAHDYRYFPDPDLLPLILTQKFVDDIKATMPELPDEKKARYIRELGLSAYDAGVIVAEKATTEYFEQLSAKHDPKLVSNWMTGELFGRLNKMGIEIENSPIIAEQLGGLIALIEDNTISGKIAKTVFEKMFETGKPAKQIVEEEGLVQVTDTGAIEKAIDEVIAANADKLAEYRSGKDKLFGFFVGQVMKATGGKANPAMLNDLLKKKLG